MVQYTLFQEGVNLLPDPGELYFFPDFISKQDSALFFSRLTAEVSWKQEPIMIAGRKILQPRLTAWCSDQGINYRYSGITMHATPWTSALQEIKKRTEDFTGRRFNGALLNFYRDGKDSMGWHRDYEKELGPRPVIASVSLGGARTFELRRVSEKKEKISILLTPGSLLLMLGETNRYWEHQVPKSSQVKESRINITFRIIDT